MAESRDDKEVHWVDPSQRGIIPLDRFHISRSLRRAMLNTHYDLRFNHNFGAVVASCADRPETWINDTIYNLYMDLHDAGYAHSQEVWDGKELIGGVYGVTLGRAFFGESMFSKRPNTSKMALAWLTDRLRETGFVLMDTQFLTAHLKSLGGEEISRAKYLKKLEHALSGKPAEITALNSRQSPQDVIQRNAQTS
ncbi:MAG: leucyl/phenylalanyl-tRNA--protein transferase [Marinosulfonomonas sp.]